MKGRNRNKGIMIMPTNSEDLAKAQHWLMCRNLEFKEFQMPIDKDKSQPVLVTEFDWVNRILYRLTFSGKSEKVNVYC